MNALILINKPVDLRSTKCVSIAKKKLGGLKVGHAGTLDSTASGLLILLAGNATRLCEFVMSLPKTYRTVIQFGAETDTYDYSGSVIRESGIEDLNMRTLNDTL
ncbi:MAG: tRNA pseudouridine(55) synthase TruB, partial [Synergistaceae bacterium]|nr:tRNA pseudouridine(55) synthase TruB [Synergistaceae bacterium]